LEGIGIGSLIDVDGPIGAFGRGLRTDVPTLLVAGGTGIAPLRSILRHLLGQDEAPTPAMIYSARTRSEFAYGAELRGLAAQGRLRLTMTTTRETVPGT